MPIEFHRDGPWELPEGWAWARLGDACQINQPPSFSDLPDDQEIPFVPMAGVAEETGAVDFSQRKRVSELRSGYTRFRSGDVLFAKITPCMENGKSAVVPDIPGGFAAGSTEFHTLRSEAFERRYLWYWLVRKAFRADAQRNMRGAVGQLRVPLEYLIDTQIAVPPLAEQRRIVARIDELFAEIADGEAALARARDDLDTWRRALLKAAVTGELTREWREGNKPNESAQDVIERIRQTVVATGNPIARRKNDQIEIDLAELPELPESWAWSRVGEIGQVTGGLTKNPDRSSTETKLPYLRVANVQYGELDLSEILDIGVTDAELDRVLLRADDLLIVEGNGSIDQIGRCAMWAGEIEPCVHQNHIIKVRFAEAPLASWAFDWLMSPHGRQLVTKVASSTSGLHTLSISKIAAIPIPVAPIAERNQILQIIKRETDNEGTTEIDLMTGVGRCSSLRQSILKAAFEGRLVAQDPRDEPAERLLTQLGAQAELPSRRRGRAGVRRIAGAAE